MRSLPYQDISDRHRTWGFNCPAVNLDFFVVEYESSQPAARVEYNSAAAPEPDLTHPNYRALANLYRLKANEFELVPFFVVRYWPGDWAVEITPVNPTAKPWFRDSLAILGKPPVPACERSYVHFLYRVRGLRAPIEVLDRCNQVSPSTAKRVRDGMRRIAA